MLINTIIAVVALAFVACVLWWAYQQFATAQQEPSPRSYDGIAGGPPPPVNNLKYDDIPLQSPISTDPRRELFESLLKADEAAANLGHDDAARAELIDSRFGNLLFRKKKAE